MRILDFRHKKRRPLTSIDVPMVPKAGLEPARISTVDFESTASTDFATSALKGMRKRSGLYLSAAAMQATACRHCAKCRKKQRYPARRHLLLPFHSATAISNPPLTTPATPAPPASHSPFPLPPKLHSKSYLFFLTLFSPESLNTTQHNPTPRSPPIPKSHFHNIPLTHPPPFPYIPESFSQCLFVIHSLRSKILISSIFL